MSVGVTGRPTAEATCPNDPRKNAGMRPPRHVRASFHMRKTCNGEIREEISTSWRPSIRTGGGRRPSARGLCAINSQAPGSARRAYVSRAQKCSASAPDEDMGIVPAAHRQTGGSSARLLHAVSMSRDRPASHGRAEPSGTFRLCARLTTRGSRPRDSPQTDVSYAGC